MVDHINSFTGLLGYIALLGKGVLAYGTALAMRVGIVLVCFIFTFSYQ